MFAATSFFPARRFAAFLDRYGTPPGRTSPDADLLAFYAYRRNLEDLAMFVDSLTAHRTDVLESSDTLRFAASTVAELAQLEPWIAAAIEVLGGASEPEAPRDPRAPVLVDGIARNSDNVTQDC
ncbi:MAG: hypothetical protein H0X16_07010 [Chloroflexi bacterium]|nr:hypothetical protein [Chloroflexota bacterium]